MLPPLAILNKSYAASLRSVGESANNNSSTTGAQGSETAIDDIDNPAPAEDAATLSAMGLLRRMCRLAEDKAYGRQVQRMAALRWLAAVAGGLEPSLFPVFLPRMLAPIYRITEGSSVAQEGVKVRPPVDPSAQPRIPPLPLVESLDRSPTSDCCDGWSLTCQPAGIGMRAGVQRCAPGDSSIWCPWACRPFTWPVFHPSPGADLQRISNHRRWPLFTRHCNLQDLANEVLVHIRGVLDSDTFMAAYKTAQETVKKVRRRKADCQGCLGLESMGQP